MNRSTPGLPVITNSQSPPKPMSIESKPDGFREDLKIVRGRKDGEKRKVECPFPILDSRPKAIPSSELEEKERFHMSSDPDPKGDYYLPDGILNFRSLTLYYRNLFSFSAFEKSMHNTSVKEDMVYSKVNVYIYPYIYIGEGNGNPLQYSYLENPMDQGAW
ncbi:hypothetical protein MG293_001751 [Ovis ammon polii]|uniref:Uncharacterized protein n=1 Tax=Ovis ammon polii TaxID=230172 RepID=A0AAD4UQ26_OVIAM|nr:hypothetical protein MG293_001751 [Ovis ammon polii]